MKVDRISYQKIFPTGMAYLNHKIGVEIEVDENDNIDNAFDWARILVEKWNESSNPSYGMAMEYMKPSENVIDKGREKTEIAIDNATSKEEVKALMNDAFKYKLETEYLTKLKSFA